MYSSRHDNARQHNSSSLSVNVCLILLYMAVFYKRDYIKNERKYKQNVFVKYRCSSIVANYNNYYANVKSFWKGHITVKVTTSDILEIFKWNNLGRSKVFTGQKFKTSNIPTTWNMQVK
jgi:hypothetical protein